MQIEDERLFGWDPTPGIVSVWAQREGQAIVWRREGEQVICTPGTLPTLALRNDAGRSRTPGTRPAPYNGLWRRERACELS